MTKLKLISLALALAAAFLGGLYLGTEQKKAALAEANSSFDKERLALAKETLSLWEGFEKQRQEAQRYATEQANRNEADAARARAALSGLRSEIADASRIAVATESSVRQYATTAGVVFGQCLEAYTRVARAADGHAADTETLMRAWPRNE